MSAAENQRGTGGVTVAGIAEERPSVLVLGGGPAGLQARELGPSVRVTEAAQAGGTSLNRGPAPVRALARTARLARDWSSWAAFALRGPAPPPDPAAAA